MRRWLYWSGWTIVLLIPIAFLIEAIRIQDVPPLSLWKVAIAIAGCAMIALGRNRDDVLKHHLA